MKYPCLRNKMVFINQSIDTFNVWKIIFHANDIILNQGNLPPYSRPWQNKVPPLEGSVEEVVRYPSDDEKNGMVLVAWRGPNAKVSSDI